MTSLRQATWRPDCALWSSTGCSLFFKTNAAKVMSA
jgi:hypothetical protein